VVSAAANAAAAEETPAPAGEASAGYRWSRSAAGDASERINVSARAAAAVATEAADVQREERDYDVSSGAYNPPPPPPPSWFTMLGVPVRAAAPAPAAAPAAPAKKKGFGGGAAAKPPPAAKGKPAAAAAPDRAQDSALLSQAEKRFAQLGEWHRQHRVSQRSFVLSVRLNPAAPEVEALRAATPSLSDWLPLADACLVDGSELFGGGGGRAGVGAVPALSSALPDASLLPLLSAAVRRAAVGARKLAPHQLQFACESASSFDAALAAARKGGLSGGELAAALATLGISEGEDGGRAAVRSAYRRAAASNHPDKHVEGSEEHGAAKARFNDIQAAYELLTQKEATGAGAADTLGSAAPKGYAAWDSGRRDFEELTQPADWEDAAAHRASQLAAGSGMGFGVACSPLPADIVSFFSLRNTMLAKQQSAKAAA